jgi:hypothetical protein
MAEDVSATAYSHMFFDNQSAGSLVSARVILQELFRIATIRSVIDVGCGVGPWLKAAIEFGVERAIGLDGDYVDRDQLLMGIRQFKPCDLETEDLRRAVADARPSDLVICMEVAEHLSPARASSFISELCCLGDLILFSAAIPGQGGVGHVNEQWPDYWSALFTDNGFTCFDVLRCRLWLREECEWWYLQNVLMFVKQDTEAFAAAKQLGPCVISPPMSLVHPRMLVQATRSLGERVAELEQLVRTQPFGREATIRSLEARVDQLRMMALDKGSEIEALRTLLEHHRTDEERLYGERDRLAQEIAAMRASTSWRITNPLRRVMTMLRR